MLYIHYTVGEAALAGLARSTRSNEIAPGLNATNERLPLNTDTMHTKNNTSDTESTAPETSALLSSFVEFILSFVWGSKERRTSSPTAVKT
jgi:hypothetical protein